MSTAGWAKKWGARRGIRLDSIGRARREIDSLGISNGVEFVPEFIRFRRVDSFKKISGNRMVCEADNWHGS